MPGAVRDSGREKVAVVAAGHAAITALRVAQSHPELFSCLVLLNPTFRGPLPTAVHDLQAKGQGFAVSAMTAAMTAVWRVYQTSFLGDYVHDRFTTAGNITHQLRSHVFEDHSHITADVVARNMAFAREGPILGKCAFLVGKADPLSNRDELRAVVGDACKVPTLVIMGYGAPETSRSDLQPLVDAAQVSSSNVRFVETRGALRSYEEYPQQIGAVIKSFIDSVHSAQQ